MSRVFYNETTHPGGDNLSFGMGGLIGTSTGMWGPRQDFPLGEEIDGSNGSKRTYVKASVALPIGTCAINATFDAIAGATHNVESPAKIGEFGWVTKERA